MVPLLHARRRAAEPLQRRDPPHVAGAAAAGRPARLARQLPVRAARATYAALDRTAVAAEIERKWLAPQIPSAELRQAGTPLRQGYLAIDGDVVVRVRIAPDEAWVTIKAGDDGLRRTEVEVPVDAADAEELWAHTS